MSAKISKLSCEDSTARMSPMWMTENLHRHFVGLTQRGQVAVLCTQHEQINRHLLARAVQSQLLVEVCCRREVLYVLRGKKTRTAHDAGKQCNWMCKYKAWTAPYALNPAHICALTLADALWLGSSLDCRAPAPRLGSCVWKTDMRPPVGDSSLKPACSAEPSADWVSMVFWNKVGKLFSRSCTSWKKITGWELYIFAGWGDRMRTLSEIFLTP